MSTSEKIKKQQQALVRREHQLTLQKIKQRKAETRRKIEWGGLVVKANMHNFSKAVILGALLDAFAQIKADDTMKTLYQQKGEAAFMGYEKK